MAITIECGRPERNEKAALQRLASDLPNTWTLFTNIPRHLTGTGARGREIDALAVGPQGAVVVELKHYGGDVMVTPLGEWIVNGELITDRAGKSVYPLQQAGKAAQMLKTALSSEANATYIEACAIATGPGATVRFSDVARPQAVAALDGAASLIQQLASRTRGVTYPALQAIFNLVGRAVPRDLELAWLSRDQAPPGSPRRTAAPPSARPLNSEQASTVAAPPSTTVKENALESISKSPLPPGEGRKRPLPNALLLVILPAVLGVLYLLLPAERRPDGQLSPPTARSHPDGARVLTLNTANASDIWSTSIYSYAPGGGGPGGGLANEHLRVGGWGDEYVSLIAFELPSGRCARRAQLRLFSLPDEGEPTPMQLYPITREWGWAPADRLWWRNLPPTETAALSLEPPTTGSWLSIDISDLYREWCTGARPNFGLMLRPVRTDHRFNRFASTRAANANQRPRLALFE